MALGPKLKTWLPYNKLFTAFRAQLTSRVLLRFSRGHLARTSSRPLVGFSRGRERGEARRGILPFRGRDEEFLGIPSFFSTILRTRLLILVFQGRGQDKARNFASFLGHFQVETRPSRISAAGKFFCVERGLPPDGKN